MTMGVSWRVSVLILVATAALTLHPASARRKLGADYVTVAIKTDYRRANKADRWQAGTQAGRHTGRQSHRQTLTRYVNDELNQLLEKSENGNQTEATEDTVVDSVLYEFYNPWSPWSRCNRRCEQHRERTCKTPEKCGNSWVKEKRTCRRRRGSCSILSCKIVGPTQQIRIIEAALYDALYSAWTPWGPCSRNCKQRRHRPCNIPQICSTGFVQEERRCRVHGAACERRYMLSPERTSGGPKRRAWWDRRPNKKPDQEGDAEGKVNASMTLGDLWGQCGVRPAGQFRIVGGENAARLSWPWMVALVQNMREQYCGGTLLTPVWVLTAAHCVRKRNRFRRFRVLVSEHNLDVREGEEETHAYDKIFTHPRFNYAAITNDIALVKLRRPVRNFEPGQFACLPSSEDSPARNTVCHTLGWGKTKNTDPWGSRTLQEARVPIVERRQCQSAFDYNITGRQLCAGFKNGGADSCAGDSGGPLLCKMESGDRGARWILQGIVSYGEGCGKRGKYGIYTRVISYLDWIHEIMASN